MLTWQRSYSNKQKPHHIGVKLRPLCNDTVSLTDTILGDFFFSFFFIFIFLFFCWVFGKSITNWRLQEAKQKISSINSGKETASRRSNSSGGSSHSCASVLFASSPPLTHQQPTITITINTFISLYFVLPIFVKGNFDGQQPTRSWTSLPLPLTSSSSWPSSYPSQVHFPYHLSCFMVISCSLFHCCQLFSFSFYLKDVYLFDESVFASGLLIIFLGFGCYYFLDMMIIQVLTNWLLKYALFRKDFKN